MTDVTIGRVSAQPASVTNGSNTNEPITERSFPDMYREALSKAQALNAEGTIREPERLPLYSSFSMGHSNTVPQLLLNDIVPRQVTETLRSVAQTEADVQAEASAQPEEVAIRADVVTQAEAVTRADVVTQAEAVTRADVVTQAEAVVPVTQASAITYDPIPNNPIRVISVNPDNTVLVGIRNGNKENLLTLTQVTDEDLISSGYDIDVLRANALDINPLISIGQSGQIPRYMLPLDLTYSTDYTKSAATVENLAMSFANNASVGFPVE